MQSKRNCARSCESPSSFAENYSFVCNSLHPVSACAEREKRERKFAFACCSHYMASWHQQQAQPSDSSKMQCLLSLSENVVSVRLMKMRKRKIFIDHKIHYDTSNRALHIVLNGSHVPTQVRRPNTRSERRSENGKKWVYSIGNGLTENEMNISGPQRQQQQKQQAAKNQIMKFMQCGNATDTV